MLLHPDSNEPMYEQLYRSCKHQIEKDSWAPGAKMPSIRRLMEELGISKTTVETAYQQLLTEGYIESRARSGYFVAEWGEHGFPVEALDPRLEPASVAVPETSPLLDFNTAQTDRRHFPHQSWARVINEALRQHGDELLAYGDPQGEYGFRKELAVYLQQSRGLRCTPDQIVIQSGTSQSLLTLLQILEGEVTGVGFEDPGYAKMRTLLARQGLPIYPVPLEADGLSVEALQENPANLVYVTPSHQFPLGMVMSIKKRHDLLDWAQQRRGYILEDDYDGEFRYKGKPIPALQGLDAYDRVIYLGTFSKAFSPGLRMSYMVLPRHLVPRYRNIMYLLESSVPRPQQKALQLFMEQGFWEKHLRKMRTLYKKKHHVLLSAIERELGDRVEVIGCDAGLHIVLRVKSESAAAELVARAERAGVRVYDFPRAWMAGDASGDPLLFVGFGGLTEEEIREGIHVLGNVVLS